VNPLAGLRVLDFTWAAAGPTITCFLGNLGADVVKVESGSRFDILRIANRTFGWIDDPSTERSGAFNEMASGKRSISVDLRTAEGRRLARRLAATADVVIENMRPGKIEELGLSYDELSAENPGLVMCSLSGSGHQDGEPLPGYAPIFWAEGGAAWFTGWPEHVPNYMRSPIDLHAGAFAFLGVMAALYERQETGRGAYVDCSAIETIAWCVQDELVAAGAGLDRPGRSGNDREPFAPHDLFPCNGDDEWIAIAVTDDGEWARLCEVLEVGHLAHDERFADQGRRWSTRAALWSELAAHTRRWEAEALAQRLTDAEVPAARMARLVDLFNDAELRSEGVWAPTQHPVIGAQDVVGLPFVVGGASRHTGRPAPLLGEHTGQVLEEWLGLDAAEIDELLTAKVLG
jgi:benzylsuccinate CoA-transferase BbsF subunit